MSEPSDNRVFVAGGADDPKQGLGTCMQCRIMVSYLGALGATWVDDKGGTHTAHEIQLFPQQNQNDAEKENSVHSDSNMSTRVTQRLTAKGSYYRVGELDLGPFTFEDEENPKFGSELATKLDVEPKEILYARLNERHRPTNFKEVAEVLSSTIKGDLPSKLVVFSAGLLAFTNEDQFNVLMASESSTGKTYIPLEIAAYFPTEIVRTLASASPTSFFHDMNMGEWDEDTRTLRLNMQGLILIFLDQQHYTLMQKLRPLLSHDKRELEYKITDKTRGGAFRTKSVVLSGFCTAMFCTASLTLDDQERTRVFMLSPETSVDKLEASLRLLIQKAGDREAFRHWVNTNLQRIWLRDRITEIQASNIKEVIIVDLESVYQRFRDAHPRLAPRHQRDLPRIISLAKAHALLNWQHRERPREQTIIANQEDVDTGFWLYNQISEANELGLPPQLYEIHQAVITPLLRSDTDGDGIDRKEILTEYYAKYGRPLSEDRLRREILPALESAGLILQQPDPTDKRKMRVCAPNPVIFSPVQKKGEDVGIPPDKEPARGASPDTPPTSTESAEMTEGQDGEARKDDCHKATGQRSPEV